MPASIGVRRSVHGRVSPAVFPVRLSPIVDTICGPPETHQSILDVTFRQVAQRLTGEAGVPFGKSAVRNTGRSVLIRDPVRSLRPQVLGLVVRTLSGITFRPMLSAAVVHEDRRCASEHIVRVAYSRPTRRVTDQCRAPTWYFGAGPDSGSYRRAVLTAIVTATCTDHHARTAPALPGEGAAEVLHQQEQVHRVGGARLELGKFALHNQDGPAEAGPRARATAYGPARTPTTPIRHPQAWPANQLGR